MIITAIKRGGIVYVYAEGNRVLWTIGCGPECELMGYTSTTVTIRRGNIAYVYNEKGSLVSTTQAR